MCRRVHAGQWGWEEESGLWGRKEAEESSRMVGVDVAVLGGGEMAASDEVFDSSDTAFVRQPGGEGQGCALVHHEGRWRFCMEREEEEQSRGQLKGQAGGGECKRN